MRQALDEGGIGVVFQPIVALGDGNPVVGFEALARFVVAPDRGPAEWFAEASEIGLGIDLELATMWLALDPIGELPSGTFLSINAAPDTVVGAGFASLRHVLRLAPDIIKIDSGVIGEVRSDRAARALTAALLSFANEMGEVVIAEGVEDDDTATVLRNLGVPYCQGFHFGEATPTPGS